MRLCLTTILTALITTWTAAAFADATPCLQRDGVDCVTVTSLQDAGVTLVKFVPGGFKTLAGVATWELFGYNDETPSQPLRLRATFANLTVDELQDLNLQKVICSAFTSEGLACTRDFLQGEWRTYSLGPDRAPFTATFVTENEEDAIATGRVTTSSWACQRADIDGVVVEVEIACSAAYSTKLSWLYDARQSQLQLTNVSCGEGAKQAATVSTASLPACNETGSYPAATWMPLDRTGHNAPYVFVNAARVFLPRMQAPLYFRSAL